MIRRASEDPRFQEHPGLELYGIESYIAVPLRRRNGEFLGTLCALDTEPRELRDEDLDLFSLLAELLSHQLEAEDEREESALALRAASERGKLRDTFIGILGHDLRNPLSAIDLSARTMLRHDELPARFLGSVRRIVNSTERILGMVDELLDFTRGRLGGGVPLEPEPIDGRELLRDVIEEVEIVHPGREVRLEAAELAEVVWDRSRIAQMLSNLVENALRHGAEDAPVTVRARRSAHGVVLEVHNRGQVIAPEERERIFDPFDRSLHGQTRREGLGLGLYITKLIADAHGGAIDVESSAAEGTTFRVRLPVRVATE